MILEPTKPLLSTIHNRLQCSMEFPLSSIPLRFPEGQDRWSEYNSVQNEYKAFPNMKTLDATGTIQEYQSLGRHVQPPHTTANTPSNQFVRRAIHKIGLDDRQRDIGWRIERKTLWMVMAVQRCLCCWIFVQLHKTSFVRCVIRYRADDHRALFYVLARRTNWLLGSISSCVWRFVHVDPTIDIPE